MRNSGEISTERTRLECDKKAVCGEHDERRTGGDADSGIAALDDEVRAQRDADASEAVLMVVGDDVGDASEHVDRYMEMSSWETDRGKSE